MPRLAACAALCAALCAPARAYYYEPPPLPQPFSIFKFKVTHWQTTGSDYFRTSFYLPPESWVPPDPDVQAGSTLDFQGLDSAIEVLSAEARLFRGFSVEAEYGSSSFSGGTAYDHDWLHAPWHILYFYTGPVWVDPIHRDFSLSRSRLAGSTELYSFNAYLRVYNSSRQRTKQTAEPLMKEKGMSSTTLRGLDSLDTGDFSGLPKDDSNLDKMEFYREHPDAQIPGGEKVREFHGRVDPELGRIIREGEDGGEPNVAFVHGSVIKELSRYLHGDIKAAQVEPGGVVGVFKIPAGGYVAKPLLKENDTSEDLPTGS